MAAAVARSRGWWRRWDSVRAGGGGPHQGPQRRALARAGGGGAMGGGILMGGSGGGASQCQRWWDSGVRLAKSDERSLYARGRRPINCE